MLSIVPEVVLVTVMLSIGAALGFAVMLSIGVALLGLFPPSQAAIIKIDTVAAKR